MLHIKNSNLCVNLDSYMDIENDENEDFAFLKKWTWNPNTHTDYRVYTNRGYTPEHFMCMDIMKFDNRFKDLFLKTDDVYLVYFKEHHDSIPHYFGMYPTLMEAEYAVSALEVSVDSAWIRVITPNISYVQYAVYKNVHFSRSDMPEYLGWYRSFEAAERVASSMACDDADVWVEVLEPVYTNLEDK